MKLTLFLNIYMSQPWEVPYGQQNNFERRERSVDGVESLLRSQKKIYEDLQKRYENSNNPNEENFLLGQMQVVARTIIDLEKLTRSPDHAWSRVYETDRWVDTFPSVVQMQFRTNDILRSPYVDKNAKMQDYERNGSSFRFSDSKYDSEKFDVLSSVSEIPEDGSYSERPFDGVLRNGDTKHIRFRFGRMTEEFQISYEQGVLYFRNTRSHPPVEGSILVNSRDVGRNGGMQKIAVGSGADQCGDGYRMVLFFRLATQ